MSLKSLLMPAISRRMLSEERLEAARAREERRRIGRGEPHRVLFFHQVDDPYSALLAMSLPELKARYDLVVEAHVVGPPADDAAPQRAQLVAYSRRDAQALAQRHGLPWRDPGQQPPARAVAAAVEATLAAIDAGRFVDDAARLSRQLWSIDSSAAGPDAASTGPDPSWAALLPPAARARLEAGQALRHRLGHYLGGMLWYAGEWYWGIDRLHHLERRLQMLGAARPGVGGLLFAPDDDATLPAIPPRPAAIDFYFSLRSPYSALAAPRIFELGRLTGTPVRLRWLLPMVMRGLPVPAAKRRYIAFDAAREARLRGLPFGCINDPVGRPTERGLSLMPLAEAQGLGPDYTLSFLRGVWAEGIDAGSDRGLRRIAERSRLRWADCRDALADVTWRATAQANRDALAACGLWGVPSFGVNGLSVWGQDRIWAVREQLLGTAGAATGSTGAPGQANRKEG